MRPLRPSHPFLALAIASLFAAAACGGATGSAVPAGSADPAASAPASTPAEASAGASPVAASGGGSAVALPEACITAIRDYLIVIEPIVSGVDWQVASEVPPQIAEQLDSEAFDPDVCPDVSAAEAHAAWAAIATDVAPGTLGYVDFIYRP